MTSAPTLRITEIFHSLQGESSRMGLPTVFVRLTGCPLRCQYCDTAYAFEGGEVLPLTDILQQVARYNTKLVTVTGGEPLAQPNALPLMQALCDTGYQVSLETSGALDISTVDPRVSVVLDLKTPGSGEVVRNLNANLPLLRPKDQIKFVICDRKDYEWSKAQLLQHDLGNRAGEILFSPSHEQLPAVQLADWILADALPVRLQIQLHKYLWGSEPGR
ncbi:MAG: 7-carboxy-7-deazaguanine synthase QueE [Pseudohongiellaceae bacterium]